MNARRWIQFCAGIVVSVSCIVLTCNRGSNCGVAHLHYASADGQMDRALVLQAVHDPRNAMWVILDILKPAKQLPLGAPAHVRSCGGRA